MWNFFTNIKEKFSGINKNYSENVLNSYTAKLVQVLQSTTQIGRATQIGERRVGKECRSRWSPYH